MTTEQKDLLISNLDTQLQDLGLRLVELEEQKQLNEATIEYILDFIDKPAKLWRDPTWSLNVLFNKCCSEWTSYRPQGKKNVERKI